ncbi:MAG: cytochrome c biogenesis protein CcsA [Candidatus Latescibacterota bacterium]
MTLACAIALGTSLLLYLAATVLFQGRLLLRRSTWEAPARRLLQAGLTVQAVGMAMHFLFSGHTPLHSMLVVVSLITIAFLGIALLLGHRMQIRHVEALAAPLAFFALLYALLMPVHFDEAESLLLRYPWLGAHVVLTLLGDVGFALAFCTAVVYLAQSRALKHGRLNRFLPPLDAAGSATYHFAAAGFVLFTLGLVMGVIWLFGAPGDYLRPQDTKIWMAVPTWLVFALYLYERGVSRQHGSRLKWLIVAGFVLAVANLLAVRHQFAGPMASPADPAHRAVWASFGTPAPGPDLSRQFP